MKLNLKNLKDYSKFINPVVVNGGSVFYKSYYFDFNNNQVILFNETTQCYVDFSFELTNEKDEDIQNFYVDAVLLNNILSLSDDVNVKFSFDKEKNIYSEVTFIVGKDNFKLPFFQDDIAVFSFDDNEASKINLAITNSLLNMFKKVTPVIPLNDNNKSMLQGIFFKNGKLIATDKIRFIDLKIVDNIEDSGLSYDILKFLNLSDGTESIEMFETSAFYKMVIDGKLNIIIKKRCDLELEVDINSPDFRKHFEADTTIKVDREELKNALNFLKTFLPSLSDDSLIIEITDGTAQLIFEDSVNKIFTNKEIVIKDVDISLVGTRFTVKFNHINELFSYLNAKVFTLQINPDAKGFNVVDTDEPENHVVIIKVAT